MKKLFLIVIAVIFITLLLPLAAVYLIGKTDLPSEPSADAGTVSVYLANEDKVVDMDINEYLTGVVAAEMPADFEYEALKAQAVAARTYLYSRIEQTAAGNIAESHNGAAVCTDYHHCQAYTADRDRYTDNISAAVTDTTGQIMTYNGEIISALFHSTSSGSTESAVDVWGNDVPYLQSVSSSGDIESPKYLSSLTISVDEFKTIAEEKIEGVSWDKPLFDNINRSSAGGIISLEIGGVTVKGTDFRSIYDLRSTNAELTEKDGDIIMSVRGYGHGVGMSQYGANYMAAHGSGYEEILKAYYTGIEIEKR